MIRSINKKVGKRVYVKSEKKIVEGTAEHKRLHDMELLGEMGVALHTVVRIRSEVAGMLDTLKGLMNDKGVFSTIEEVEERLVDMEVMLYSRRDNILCDVWEVERGTDIMVVKEGEEEQC